MFGGMVPGYVMWLAPLAIVLPFGALAVGMQRSTSPLRSRRFALGTVWLVMTAAILLIPGAVSWAWLQRESGLLPLPDPCYAGSNGKQEFDIVRFNDQPDLTIDFITRDSPEAVYGLYRKELPKSGWVLIHSDKIDDQGVGVGSLQTLFFERRGRTLKIRILEFDTPHTSLQIELQDPRPGKPKDDPRRLMNKLGGVTENDTGQIAGA